MQNGKEYFMNRYIWLIGENLGNTANNNSYYFWLSSMENDDDIDKYYVFCDNRKNRKIYKSLPAKYKKNIVWRNTVRHLKLYVNADMFFVTLKRNGWAYRMCSTRDFTPRSFMTRIAKVTC